MKAIINHTHKNPFLTSKRDKSRSVFHVIKSALIPAVLVICMMGCDISNSEITPKPDKAEMNVSANIAIFSEAKPFDTCPVVTGQDVAGVVAPMFHPHVFNVQLRKAEGLLLPAVQAVHGHFQIKLCETLTENYQSEWNLRINNKEGLGFTGWALVDRETEDELFGVQFPNKVESNRKVQSSGIMEVDGTLLDAPQDYMIVIRTTNSEVNLVGLLLPAVQAN